MFPKSYEEKKILVPEAYFGGSEVPPYLHIPLPKGCPTEDIIRMIRAIGTGSNSSGYIDAEGVHFHIPSGDRIQVDLSKEFIFASQPAVPGAEHPSAWQAFCFLQEPVDRALLVGAGRATQIRKTEKTNALCKVLDGLWLQERFLQVKMEMIASEESLEKGLARLMKTYEEEKFGSSSEMWEFWQTFATLLMRSRLGLEVCTVETESECR
jgi:hypothetical protein